MAGLRIQALNIWPCHVSEEDSMRLADGNDWFGRLYDCFSILVLGLEYEVLQLIAGGQSQLEYGSQYGALSPVNM